MFNYRHMPQFVGKVVSPFVNNLKLLISDLRLTLNETKDELRSDMDDLSSELRSDMDDTKQYTKENIEDLLKRFKELEDSIPDLVQGSINTTVNTTTPIGTICIWPSYVNPPGWSEKKWLECNGQAISQAEYPDLYALIGGNVPDLRERAPWGSNAPGQYREAGLPNIWGVAHNLRVLGGGAYSGGFWSTQYVNLSGFTGREPGSCGGFSFDASRCSPVYGRSTTVQPAAYTVRYIIRSKH